MATSLLPSPDSSPLLRTSPGTDETTVVATCRAVASLSDADPLDLPPLCDDVDTDAVEAVASPRHTTGHIAFEYLDYVVVVHAHGEIAVYDEH